MNRFISYVIAVFACLWAPVALAQAEKPLVGVYAMEDLAGTGQSDTFSTMIETAIASTGKFRVMERENMARLLQEQGRARSGMVTSNTPNRSGGFEGIDYLIYGTITSVSVTRKSNLGDNLVGGLFGNRNSNCNNAYVTMEADIKITDANTGEVRYVTRISEQQRSDTVCGAGAQIDSSALMRAAADNIATGLVTTIYPIQVAAVQPDGLVVLNYGEGAVFAEDYMSVFQEGEPIRDPATGEIIATNEVYLGTIYVTEVQGRVSRAMMAMGFDNGGPPVGAIVRVAGEDEAKQAKKAMRRRR